MAAGGTGGHFYPGLVLSQTLRARGWDPLILVKRGDPCLPILEKEGIPAVEIDLAGLPRRLSLDLIRFSWRLVRSLSLTGRVLKDFRPSVVVGMGGYLSFPLIFSAARRRLPRAVHESNSILGLANRSCRAMGAKVFWGLPPRFSRGKVTGTPIRPSLWSAQNRETARMKLGLSPDLPTVFVFGGSQGATALNRHVPKALRAAAEKGGENLQVLHITGKKDQDQVRRSYGPLPAVILPYLESIESAYAAADLVICRAGASTMAELSAQKKPAVLIPYPHAASRHQDANARVFSDLGAAKLIPEKEIPQRLAAVAADLLFSSSAASTRRGMSEAYASLRLPTPSETAARLAKAVETLVQDT